MTNHYHILAPPFLERELLWQQAPQPFEQTNATYAMYCLAYRQNTEEDEHVEDVEPPVCDPVALLWFQ
ncbi:hypothetical protein QWY14_07855 [Planococcus sp. N028]|uniref:Uncharacterized protein n=1 Tax=Planococcus shixiaomingii TaxID=3058393 RepID=A0ABT8N1F9_9BACL|nr:hypothetical protein [Planococcus sp. N028]MDN7241704.1 hypothetical protein [Planococcus sp. N028]